MQASEKRKLQTKKLISSFSKWVNKELGLVIDKKTKDEIFEALTVKAKTQNDVFTVEIKDKIIEVGLIQSINRMSWRCKL